MTLVMRASLNVGKTGGFAIATADTRMVIKSFNTGTLEFADGLLETRDDIYDKVMPLTENVLLTVGGYQLVFEPLRDFVVGRAKQNYFLDDFEQIFRDAYNYFKENGDDAVKKYLDSDYVHFSVTGFFKNGNPGEISLFENGKIVKEETTPGNYRGRMFSPTEEINDKLEELMDFNNSPFIAESDALTGMIDHLLYVHAIIASQEVETVSETSVVHIVFKNENGEISYHNASYDLSDQIKQIQAMT